jgi:hypothetical protein
MHAGLGPQPAVSVVAGEVDARALDAGDFAVADVDDLGLEAVLLAPAQVHAQQHLRPILRFGAARSRLDVEERAVRVHLAGEHALELELLDVALQRREVALDGLCGRLVVFFDGQGQQLAGVLEPIGHAVERAHDLLQAGALAAQLLGLVRRVPDRGVFQLPAYLGEPLALEVVLKGTSSAPHCAR